MKPRLRVKAAAARVVPSAEQLKEELKDYFKKMDEEDLKCGGFPFWNARCAAMHQC